MINPVRLSFETTLKIFSINSLNASGWVFELTTIFTNVTFLDSIDVLRQVIAFSINFE